MYINQKVIVNFMITKRKTTKYVGTVSCIDQTNRLYTVRFEDGDFMTQLTDNEVAEMKNNYEEANKSIIIT
jgi:hypothetical protein